jgi:hypothetical protein
MFDPDLFGTVDILIIVPGERIIVIDFKHGRGVTVEPDSSQLKYYGALSLENLLELANQKITAKVIELYIVQPRIPHPKGPIRKLVMNPEELEQWFTDELLPAAEATRSPNAMLYP